MFEGISGWAVTVSVVASAVLGMLWYSPLLFAKRWMAECGLGPDDVAPRRSGHKYFGALVNHAVGIVLLALVMKAYGLTSQGIYGAWQGLLAGLAVSLGFMVASRATNYLYEGRSFVLFLINSGYNVLVFGVAGIILAVWV